MDGRGDTTLLARTYATTGPTEIASAYFAPPGAPFTPLALPGAYFTALASDAAGRSAIAGVEGRSLRLLLALTRTPLDSA